MDCIDKFINYSANNYDGAGCCSDIEWFDDNVGVGHGVDYNLGKGRGDSNGTWDLEGYGEGRSYGGYVSAKTNEVICCCYVKTNNLYGKHR